MDEQLYPKLQGGFATQAALQDQGPMPGETYKMNFMMDKQETLKEKLIHYEKIKGKWSLANTVLKKVGISVSCILGGASILTTGPLSIPIAAAILGGISLGEYSSS